MGEAQVGAKRRKGSGGVLVGWSAGGAGVEAGEIQERLSSAARCSSTKKVAVAMVLEKAPRRPSVAGSG